MTPKRETNVRTILVLSALVTALPAAAAAPAEPSRMDRVLDAAIAAERDLAGKLESYRPLVETYIQTVKPDPALGTVPVKDNYFIARLELDAPPAPKQAKKQPKKALSLLEDFHSAVFKPEDFARMLILDRGAFGRDVYDFDFLRAEFLGDVRTYVFDVTPKTSKPINTYRPGRFTGRIWIEDQGNRIVRYNGIYASELAANFHFDSWRMNLAEGLWLPAYVYTEEADKASKQLNLVHKGQIRVWGYRLPGRETEDEFTKVVVETADTKDRSEASGHVSPVESARAWEAEAEDNVIRRLERSGLLAPDGKLDDVLETVVTNLEITSELDIQPPVKCRVLLTTPLESFTVGHTIVLSRGLIDVLPDEASLAMVLAHELGHVISGHDLDTRFAFTDRVLVGDRDALQQFDFQRDPTEEAQADAKAVELLAKSPYKDKLASAGLFLKALDARSIALRALIRPHFGNQLYKMAPIVQKAPALDLTSVQQTSALPLGGRVKVDPWTAHVELMPSARVTLLSAREKMPFQVTPLMPYLARFGSQPKEPSKAPDVSRN